MSANQIESQQTVTANSSASNQISLPDAQKSKYVTLEFHGDHQNDVFLVQNSGDSSGIPIPADSPKTLSYFRTANAPTYLYTAGSNTDVVVTVTDGGYQTDASGDVTVEADIRADNEEFTESGITTSASYSWNTYQPNEKWIVRAFSFFTEETGGSESFDYQIYGTNKNSPSSPSGSDPDDWFEIVGPTTVSASSEDDTLEVTNAEQIAVGVVDNSGSATLDYELRVLASSDVVELIRTLETRIGSTSASAAGYDSSGSVIAQMRELIKTTGDDSSSSVAGYNSSGTVLEQLLQLQKAKGDETATGSANVETDPTNSATELGLLKGSLARLRDDLGEASDVAAGYDSTGSALSQLRELVKTTGDDGSSTPAGHASAGTVLQQLIQNQKAIGNETATGSSNVETDPTNAANQINLLKGTLARLRDDLGETSNAAAGYDSTGSAISQLRELVKTAGDDGSSSVAGYNSAGTIIEQLLQIQKAKGDETATGSGNVTTDPTTSATELGLLKGSLARLRDDLGETNNAAAGFDSDGSVIAQNREIVKTLGDDANATAAGYNTAGKVIEQLIQIGKVIGDDSSVTSQTTAGTADNAINYLSGLLQTIQDVWVSNSNEFFGVEEQNVIESVNRGVVDGSYSPKTHISSALNDEEQVSASESILYSAVANVTGGLSSGEYFVQFWDGAVDTDGQVNLVWQESFHHDGTDDLRFNLDVSNKPLHFSSQLRVALSSTGTSYTAAGDQALFTVSYQD